jgi:hypothetical protein
MGPIEFWDAVAEHPSLINGPVARTAAKASICRSESALRSFLISAFPWLQPSLEQKTEAAPVSVVDEAVTPARRKDVKPAKTKSAEKKTAKTGSPTRKKSKGTSVAKRAASDNTKKRVKRTAQEALSSARARRK